MTVPESPLSTIATWNVNGVRARIERITAWLRDNPVDVLCLQETKVADDQFPLSAFDGLGYEIAIFGQKSFNGVAILSRFTLEDIARGFPSDSCPFNDQKRLIAATIAGIRVYCAYFPNGQALGTDKYQYKLEWISSLEQLLHSEIQTHPHVVLCGDFNVAPEPRDTHDPAIWEGNILCSPEERAAIERLRNLGLHDALRAVHPTEQVFTWWDYRALGFPQNRGLRIDHFYITAPLLQHLRNVSVDREERKGPQPSDHAPVIMHLERTSAPPRT